MRELPGREPTTTQLRTYYEALLALKEEEQTVLAEFHAQSPKLLIHRFVESVKAAELIGSDRPPYFAFVQALMHAAELVSETQRDRLGREYERPRSHGRPTVHTSTST